MKGSKGEETEINFLLRRSEIPVFSATVTSSGRVN